MGAVGFALALALVLTVAVLQRSPSEAPPPRAASNPTDPAPALDYLGVLMGAFGESMRGLDFDDPAALDRSIRGMNTVLHNDLRLGPDLTLFGRSCEEAHTHMRSLIRSWVRVGELMRIDDIDAIEQERVRGRALSAELDEALYRCRRGI